MLIFIQIMLETWIREEVSDCMCSSFGNGTWHSWKSKLQPTIAKPSMEAEYMALCFGTCEILEDLK